MRIGIDLGGTKTEIICLDRKNGKELYRQRVPTERGNYVSSIKNLVTLIEQAEKTLGMTGTVGVGIPGTVSEQTGLVKNANSVWLNGHPFDKDLSQALQRPVRVENDANCFAVSEATDGAAAGKKVVFGVIIGTGCGGGIVINGKAVKGLNAITGEWGHNPLPYPRVFGKEPNTIFERAYEKSENHKVRDVTYFTDDAAWSEYPGPLCYCGRHGCQETWISGTGFKNDYKRVTGEELSTHDIIAAAEAHEPKAQANLTRYIDRMARALAHVMNLLDPDAIVLGGGMSNVSALYTEIPKVWAKYIFSDTIDTPVLQARHGDSSGVRGAAWLWNKDD